MSAPDPRPAPLDPTTGLMWCACGEYLALTTQAHCPRCLDEVKRKRAAS